MERRWGRCLRDEREGNERRERAKNYVDQEVGDVGPEEVGRADDRGRLVFRKTGEGGFGGYRWEERDGRGDQRGVRGRGVREVERMGRMGYCSEF